MDVAAVLGEAGKRMDVAAVLGEAGNGCSGRPGRSWEESRNLVLENEVRSWCASWLFTWLLEGAGAEEFILPAHSLLVNRASSWCRHVMVSDTTTRWTRKKYKLQKTVRKRPPTWTITISPSTFAHTSLSKFFDAFGPSIIMMGRPLSPLLQTCFPATKTTIQLEKCGNHSSMNKVAR